jgi:membrane protease YdiL (CAAX protease family)
MAKNTKNRKAQKNNLNKIVYSVKIFFLGYLLYIVPSVIATMTVVSVVASSGSDSIDEVINNLQNSPLANLFVEILTAVIVVVGIILLTRSGQGNWKNIGLSKPQPKHLLYVPVAFIAYLAIDNLIKHLFGNYINFNQEIDTGYNAAIQGADLVYAFLVIVVVAPLMEEFLFRGYIYSRFKEYLSILPSVLLVSLLFGYDHLHSGKGGSIALAASTETFIASIVLVALREKTGNIWAGVVLHLTNNLISFIIFFKTI